MTLRCVGFHAVLRRALAGGAVVIVADLFEARLVHALFRVLIGLMQVTPRLCTCWRAARIASASALRVAWAGARTPAR
eukprot:3829510-Pyramimonas_sp.AAC.1